MSKTLEVSDETERTIKVFKKMGYKTTTPKHKNTNGVDLFVISDDNVLSVEIKKARIPKSNAVTYRVDKVEKNRKDDDLIAIVFPHYILIEPMRDHLRCCNKSGQRFIFL